MILTYGIVLILQSRYRRWSLQRSANGSVLQSAKVEKGVQEALVRHDTLAEWRTDLKIAQRLAKRAPAPERPEPSDVSGKIRESIRNEVQDKLAEFLADATPEEMRLMRDVITTNTSWAWTRI